MNPIFAQAVAIETSSIWNAPPGLYVVLAMGLAGAAVLLSSLVAVVTRNAHRRREWEHAERMRTLEMGLPVAAREDSAWPKALVCTAIGFGVPFISFVFISFAHGRPGAADELWIVPALVSGASVIASAILTGYLFQKAPVSTPERLTASTPKPEFDPDAYDVAGRRG